MNNAAHGRKTLLRISISLLTLLAASVLVASVAAADLANIEYQSVGEWTMCRDPDKNPRDRLQFFSEGYGFVMRTGSQICHSSLRR